MRRPNTRAKTQRRSGGRRLFALLSIMALSGALAGSTVVTGVSLAGAAAPSTDSASSKYQAPTVAPGDWPMYGHDVSRTNYNPDETNISEATVPQLVSRWQFNVGTSGTPPSSAPSVSGGKVYVGSSAPSGSDFFAFDAVTGSSVYSVSLNYQSSCFNVGIGSTAAISGSIVSVGGGDPAYYGLNANNGTQLWRNLMNVGASGFPWESPLMAYSRSYVGIASRCDNPSVRGEIRAVDINTGATINSQYFVPSGQQGGGIWNSPALSPDGSTLVVVTGEDYSCSPCTYTQAMVSLDPISLNILQWNQQGAFGQDLDFGTTPLIFHDSQSRVLVGANHKNGTFYTYVLNNLTAGPLWSRSTGTDVGMMPAYDPTFGSGGTLFIAGSSNRIFAVDPATGLDRWPAVTVGTMHGNMAIANGLIFVNLGSSGLGILRESDGSTVRTLTPANAGSANSGVAVSNGFIYWQSGSYINAWSLPATTPTNTPTRTATAIPTFTPTATPTSVLVGHVTWQGRPAQPDPQQQLPITLTLKSGATEVNYPSVTTDASGFFTVPLGTVPPGTYDWRVKGPQYLANSGSVGLASSNVVTFERSNVTTSVEMGLMRAGDADGDNLVNSADFNILRATYGKSVGDPGYDARADFDGDNTIGAGDFNLLRANYGTGGAPPLRPGGYSVSCR